MVKRNAQKNKMEDPHAVLALSILYEAKKDAQMWNDFVDEWGEKRDNYDSHGVALWVMGWINKHRTQAIDMGISENKIKSLIEEVK